MNELENNKNDNTDQLSKKPKATKVTSASPLSSMDKRILNDVKNNRPMDRICAQYMVHKHYVEALVEKNK